MARPQEDGRKSAMKVLILSASTGNGHMSAAHAVEEVLIERGHDAKTVDVLDHTGKGFRGWYRGGYEVLVRRKPKVWGHLYKSSDRKLFNYRFQTALDTLFVRKMRAFVMAEKPDWVLCTHSLPQPSLDRWRPRMKFRLGVVVTDLYPQLMWLRGRPDHFFVPGEWTQEILAKRYPQSVGRTTVTGIPINRLFAQKASEQTSRRTWGFRDDTPLVLVTSGGIGGGPIGKVIDALDQVQAKIQVAVVCGRSERAIDVASERAKASVDPGKFRVLGLVSSQEMAALMHASDLIVAKPGGITTFEALAAGLPFVVFEPFLIPGQEEQNAEFLVESGIGIRLDRAPALTSEVDGLLSSPSRLNAMAQMALNHAKPDAAERIVDKLELL